MNPQKIRIKEQKFSALVLSVALALVLLPLLGPNRFLLIEPVVFRLSLLIFLIPLWLMAISLVGKRIYIGRSMLIPSLLMVTLLGFLTCFWADSSYQAQIGTIRWLCVTLLAIVVFNLAQKKKNILFIMGAAAIGGGAMALIGVIQYAFGFDFYPTSPGEYSWPPATSGHKNQAAQFVVMTLPLAAGIGYVAKTRATRWFFSIVTALMLAFLVYARARQAMLALLIECAMFLVIFRSGRILPMRSDGLERRRTLPAMASVALFLGLVLAPPFDKPFAWENSALNRLLERNLVYYQEGTDANRATAGRLKIWGATLEMLPDFWFGAGLHNWAVHYPRYNAMSEDNYIYRKKTYAGDTHNDYLQLVIELGYVVVVIALLVLVGIFKAGRSILRRGSGLDEWHFWLLSTGLLGLATVMFFSFPLSRMLQPAYMGVYLALIAALGSDNEAYETTHAFGSRGVALLSGVLALMTVAGAWGGYRLSAGNHYLWATASLKQKIEVQMADKNLYPDVSGERLKMAYSLKRSMELDPYNSRIAADRAGVLTYLVLTEENSTYKAVYARQAESQFRLAEDFFPYGGFQHHLHSRLAASQGDLQQQKYYLEKAVKYDPGNPKFVGGLINWHMSQEDNSSALVVADHFIRRFYDEEIMVLYAYLGQETGNLQSSLDVLNKISIESRNPFLDEEELVAQKAKLNQMRGALQTQIGQL